MTDLTPNPFHVLEEAGFRRTLMSAVEAATRRSCELGKG